MSYTFQNTTYDNLFSLAKDMYLKSDDYAKELRKDALLSFIEEKDKSKFEKIARLSLESMPDDVFVFRASYILNPHFNLRIKGRSFPNYQTLGEHMLYPAPNPDPILLELLRFRLLSLHMEVTGYRKENQDVYQKVKDLEEENQEEILFRYFSLAFYLSKEKAIIYQGVKYQNLFNFCYYIYQKSNDISALGAYLSISPYMRVLKEYSSEGKQIDEFLHLSKSVTDNENALEEFLEKRKKKE